MFGFGMQNIALSYGPPNYLPDGPRPRLWLNEAELSRLNAKQVSGDPAWLALESWCDTHLGDVLDNYGDRYDVGKVNWNGYRMGGYSNYLMNFGLAYQVLKNDNPIKAANYAAYLRNLLVDGILVGLRSGEENNGLAALRCGEGEDRTINTSEGSAGRATAATYKLGYSARNLMAVPIAYDWIFDTLSQADRVNLESMMFRWFDWIRGVRSEHNNGVLIDGVRYFEDQGGDCSAPNICTSYSGAPSKGYSYGNMSNNFMGGFSALMSLIPVATYEASSDAENYLTAYKSLLADTIVDQLEGDLKHSGGDSVEGWNYGGGFHYGLQGLYGYYTATGDNAIFNMKWPKALAQAAVHRSGPNLLDVPIYGDWTGIPLGVNRRYMALTFFGILQRLHPNNEIAQVGQYFLNHVPYDDNPQLWEELLWYRSDIPAIDPASQPLSYLAKGNGFYTSRSSWANSPDTVFTSIRLEGKQTASHEGYDEGHFSLQRGANRLLAHQNMQPNSVTYNTVVFNNQNHQAANPTQATPSVDRIVESGIFSYVSGDITNAFKRQWKIDNALLFRRSMLHIRPNIIVINDVTQSNSVVGLQKDWYTQYIADPVIAGDTITVTVGQSRAFIKSLYPTGGSFTETTPATGWWRVKYTPALQQEFDQFLHVIEATDKNQPTMTKTVRIDATSGNMRGVFISDPISPIGSWIAMFTADKDGTLIGDDVSYVVPIEPGYPPFGHAPKHILLDLAPNTDFTFIAPKSKNAVPQVFTLKRGAYPAEGRVYTSSSQGVIHIETLSKVRTN
jgi:hypothetical protein